MEVTLGRRVGRGEGGRLQLVCGVGVPTDEALQNAPLGEVVFEEEVTGSEMQAFVVREVMPGDWCYPRVFDPLIAPGLTEEEADLVREAAVGAAATGEGRYAPLAKLVLKLVDPFALLFNGSLCDPETWNPDILQCMPPDNNRMATFFVPDRYDRALNVLTENGLPTDWSMGAVASAVLFVSE